MCSQQHMEERAGTRDTAHEVVLRAGLVQSLQETGAIWDKAVAQAMSSVPRHLFLPGLPPEQAYTDTAIPTKWEGQVAVSSASQPAIVAIMLQQLQVGMGDHVLEIGAGTGYNAGLLAELVGPSGTVTSIDIDAEIAAAAREHLAVAGYTAVRVVAADGAAGWEEQAPYDRIILTVGASDIAPAWYDQLREDGILVIPLWLSGVELSVAFRKHDGKLTSLSQTQCGFMRLRGEEAGTEQWVSLSKGRQLFAQRAADLAAPVSALLATRPRVRLWSRPRPSFFQHLGLRGYRLVTIYSERKPRVGRRLPGRWGIYSQGRDGPSLALFALWSPVLLAFGGHSAERILAEEFERWQDMETEPTERWHIDAYPRTQPYDIAPAEGDQAMHITRRHFIFTVDMGGRRR